MPTPLKLLSHSLKAQPAAFAVGLVIIASVGFGLSILLDANPIVETGVVFLIGLMLGGAIAKFNQRSNP